MSLVIFSIDNIYLKVNNQIPSNLSYYAGRLDTMKNRLKDLREVYDFTQQMVAE